MARVKDPSKLEKVDMLYLKSKYWNQYQHFLKCYPGDVKLSAWHDPYIFSIDIYGPYSKIKEVE